MVLKGCGASDAEDLEEYIAKDGYRAFEKALFDMSGEAICREISDSGLRGRGGGGFPAGRKWESVRKNVSDVKYIVCNGDEGDPGAFMDRSIMEGNPHSVIEGMMIAGVATGATQGYIYVRAEYPLAVERLQVAIDKATRLGLLGDNIMDSGFSFHMHINRGAGAFVCGEGSALTASIEGNRGMPRVKPPRTVEQGLWARPTVLNNVETFSNVPLIIRRGSAWYRSIGTERSHGTKAFALTGNVVNTGLIEVPMGTTLRQIIFEIGGGIKDGKKFKPVQSTLKYFRDEYLAHVVEKHCPHCNGRKKELHIDPELCKGCGKCMRQCPMEAISGQIRMPHVIDTEKCIKCGACWGCCPFGAIREE